MKMRSRWQSILAFLLIAGCGLDVSRPGSADQPLYDLTTVTWPNPNINLCWETPGFATQKSWIQSWLATPGNRTWMDWSPVRFAFTEGCNGTPTSTVHLCFKTDPGGSFTSGGLGTSTAGKFCGTGGITFGDGSCASGGGNEQLCLQNDALHEFGHMLGFSHEQNRPDDPCGAAQGTNGDTPLGVVDNCSVMSYCLTNSCPNAPGGSIPNTLSVGDSEGVQAIYGYSPFTAIPGGWMFPAHASVTAIARTPQHLDIFAVATDGAVYTSWWDQNYNNANWNGWSRISNTGLVPPGSQVSAIARYSNLIDIFYVTWGGLVASQYHLDGGAWSSTFALDTGHTFPWGSPVTVLNRNPDHIEAYVAGSDGSLWINWWERNYNNNLWHTFWPQSGSGLFPQRTEFAALSIDGVRQDLFAVDNWGRIRHISWDPTFSWGGWGFAWTDTARVGSVPAVTAQSTTRVNLAVQLSGGGISSGVWDTSLGGLGQLGAINSLNVSGAAKLTMIQRKPGHLDLFVMGSDGAAYSAWFDPNLNVDPNLNRAVWYQWHPIGLAKPGSPGWVMPVARGAQHIDIFAVDGNGAVKTAWWNAVNPL